MVYLRFLLLFAALAQACVAAEPGFVANAVFPSTDRGNVPPGTALWGSWIGGDGFRGRGESAWIPAKPHLGLYVAGYAGQPGRQLWVEWRDQAGRVTSVAYAASPPRERWLPWRLDPPEGSVAVRWVAVDDSVSAGGWFGVSDFVDTKWQWGFAPLYLHALVAFGVLALAIVLLGLGGTEELVERILRKTEAASSLRAFAPLLGMAILAAVGYLAFYVWFFSARIGAGACLALVAIGCARGAWRLLRGQFSRAAWVPWSLATLIGAFYLTLLLYPQARSFGHAAANRFTEKMPADNEFPGIFAQRLADGKAPRGFLGEWLGSDRPPAQTGWDLLFWPILKPLGISSEIASGVAGVWLQLAWIPAVWAGVQAFGLSRRRAALAVVSVAALGFVLLNTVYVWPKLSSAAFTLAGGLIWLGLRKSGGGPLLYGACGGLFALGWLCHGGSAFALIGFIPLLLADWRGWRHTLAAGAVFALWAAPWMAYQKFYDPPGNRLLKWHLAGSPAVDARGFVETVRAQYEKVGFKGAWDARVTNLSLQFEGDWAHLWRADSSQMRRYVEAAFYLRSASFFLPAGMLAWLVITRRRKSAVELDFSLIVRACLWMVSSWLVWLALLFTPLAALAHQGAYVIPLLLYMLALTPILALSSRIGAALAILQLVSLLAVWSPWDARYINLQSPPPSVSGTR